MIPSFDELELYVSNTAAQSGWALRPSHDALLRLRARARTLNDGSGYPVIEAAALFCAFAEHERLLGDGATALPGRVALYRLAISGLRIPASERQDLQDLQDDVASGGEEEQGEVWRRVSVWFLERAVPA